MALDPEDFDTCFKVSDLEEVQDLKNRDLFLLTHATDDYGNYESKKITLQRVIKAVKNRGFKTELNLLYDIQGKYFDKSNISAYSKIGHKHDVDDISNFPANVSYFTNDAGYITSATIPTKVSDLENDVPFLSTHQDISHLAEREELTAYSQVGHTHVVGNITDFPANVSYFNNDANYLSSHQDITHLATKDELTAYAPVEHTHLKSQITDFPKIPTKFSELTNDIQLSSYSEIHDQLSNDGYGIKVTIRDWKA